MKNKMKTSTFISASILIAATSFAQTKMDLKPSAIVPPTTYNQIELAQGFSNPNWATADLFSKAGKKEVSIPGNYMGTQESESDDYYYGIMTYKGDKTIDFQNIGNGGIVEGKAVEYKYAEYIQIQLSSKLEAGKEYEMVLKVSLADNAAFATKGFGIYFSDAKFDQKNNKILSVEPQVKFSELITDKNAWTEIKSKFKATGTETFATIGCFENGYAVEKVGGGKSFGTVRAYYYLSGIKIMEAPKPDRDKDGISDDMDSCPDVAGLENFKGCPDSDGDGIADKDDICPTIAGLAKFTGCPDSDNDGIADNNDKCPLVAGLPTNNGCPEVKIDTKSQEVFTKAMAGIQFESGKDIIKKTSFGILDNVADVLKGNPAWNVEIQGHTDNAGKYESNKTLSEKRAIAVKKYLQNKGVTNSMSPAGYGPDKPIADNATQAGKAKNRRVEFKVQY